MAEQQKFYEDVLTNQMSLLKQADDDWKELNFL